MQKIQIVFVPTAEPVGEDLGRSDEAALGVLPAEYVIATLVNGRYHYENKIILTYNGEVLQIITKNNQGRFTVATLENAFQLSTQPICLELVDVNGDRSEYRLRLSANTLTNPLSQVLLYSARNPQIAIAEVTNIEGSNQTRGLGFIGTEDIRPSIQAKVMIPPGQPTEIRCTNGDIQFKF